MKTSFLLTLLPAAAVVLGLPQQLRPARRPLHRHPVHDGGAPREHFHFHFHFHYPHRDYPRGGAAVPDQPAQLRRQAGRPPRLHGRRRLVPLHRRHGPLDAGLLPRQLRGAVSSLLAFFLETCTLGRLSVYFNEGVVLGRKGEGWSVAHWVMVK
ncbi:hypothetical protein PG997_010192 [Apiospora hydei]|uniref:Uncharacterized protein n=1 Tax=Apiospora hydei TaxID=1337664 RepID=A0ABR1W022_9PEZI